MLRGRSLGTALAAAVLVVLLPLPTLGQVDGEHYAPGSPCPSGSIAGQAVTPDWDTFFECNASSNMQRGPYFFGSSPDACDSNHAGMVQWTGSSVSPNNTMEFCNGTSWGPLATSSSVTLGTSTTAANPYISGDATSGFYTPGAKTVAVVTGGNEALRVTSSGYVGIGTATPGYQLDVEGGLAYFSGNVGINSNLNSTYALAVNSNGQNIWFGLKSDGKLILTSNNSAAQYAELNFGLDGNAGNVFIDRSSHGFRQ
jgi:hypothetical protein